MLCFPIFYRVYSHTYVEDLPLTKTKHGIFDNKKNVQASTSGTFNRRALGFIKVYTNVFLFVDVKPERSPIKRSTCGRLHIFIY